MPKGKYPRPRLRKPCKHCDKMFTPVTKHSLTCDSCLKKAHIAMVQKKRAEKKNGKY
jgi:hypothetical protein